MGGSMFKTQLRHVFITKKEKKKEKKRKRIYGGEVKVCKNISLRCKWTYLAEYVHANLIEKIYMCTMCKRLADIYIPGTFLVIDLTDSPTNTSFSLTIVKLDISFMLVEETYEGRG